MYLYPYSTREVNSAPVTVFPRATGGPQVEFAHGPQAEKDQGKRDRDSNRCPDGATCFVDNGFGDLIPMPKENSLTQGQAVHVSEAAAGVDGSDTNGSNRINGTGDGTNGEEKTEPVQVAEAAAYLRKHDPSFGNPEANGNQTPDEMDNIPDAAGDLYEGYTDMRNANFKNSDKYFHCVAHCNAGSRGPVGEWTSVRIGNLREIEDQRLKGYPREDSVSDQEANRTGREAGRRGETCKGEEGACRQYRPDKLPSKY